MLETKKKGKRCERRGREEDEAMGMVAPHASSPVQVLHRSSWRYLFDCVRLRVWCRLFGTVAGDSAGIGDGFEPRLDG